MSMIKLESISKTFGEKEILQQLSLEVKKNDIIALLGPNGCGKSTTLNIIAGLLRPDQGQVFINEELVEESAIGKKVHRPPSMRKLGYVLQNTALFPHMTIRENVTFGLKEDHLSVQELDLRVKELLDFVGLAEFGKSYPHQLSGGQKQRASLARSIAKKPEILLLDEPISSMDTQFKESLRQSFKRFLRDLKITTIYVTHDLTEALFMADKIAILGNGHIEQVGTRDEVLSQPKSKFIAEFLGINVYEGTAFCGECGQDQIEIAGVPIFAPTSSYSPGDPVRVMIRPEDVTLQLKNRIIEMENGIKSNNILEGVVVNIFLLKSSAQITVDVGFRIKSELPLKSYVELQLTEGKKVYVQFRAMGSN